MLHRTLIAIAVLAFAMLLAAADAAGPFDGKWVGTAPEAGDCGVLTVTLVVANNQITGTVAGKHGSPTIRTGAIATDGTANVTYAIGNSSSAFSGTIKFVGNAFSGRFQTVCGFRDTTGARVQ